MVSPRFENWVLTVHPECTRKSFVSACVSVKLITSLYNPSQALTARHRPSQAQSPKGSIEPRHCIIARCFLGWNFWRRSSLMSKPVWGKFKLKLRKSFLFRSEIKPHWVICTRLKHNSLKFSTNAIPNWVLSSKNRSANVYSLSFFAN